MARESVFNAERDDRLRRRPSRLGVDPFVPVALRAPVGSPPSWWAIAGEGFNSLVEGARVEFESRQGDKGPLRPPQRDACRVKPRVPAADAGGGCGRYPTAPDGRLSQAEEETTAGNEARVEIEGEVVETLTQPDVQDRARQWPRDARVYGGENAALSIRIFLGDRVR